MKNRLLLGVLLLPALAQAGTGYHAPGGEGKLVSIILAPFVLPPLLLLGACLRPQSKVLQLGLGLAIGGLAWLWSWLGPDRSSHSITGVVFYVEAFLPLALLLNGLGQARQAARLPAQLAWAGIAVAGGSFLGWSLLSLWQVWLGSGPGLLAHLLLTMGSWLLVLRWLRRAPALSATLWQGPWWRTPAVASGVAAVFLLVKLLPARVHWSSTGLLLLYVAVVTLLTGLVALRLLVPLVVVAGEPGYEPAPTPG
jgi:hypothetical protein